MTKITKSFQYVEFFAGIGGFRSALDKVGGECIFASEIEKNAKTSYAALYGPEHLHGDVTKIDAINVPDHDVLAGGFLVRLLVLLESEKDLKMHVVLCFLR